MPEVTTVVSYSDPSVGHTGALYRACNWLWAPTWHRLRPPPSGNGSWKDGSPQSVKDRWVFPLRADDRRREILRVKDESIVRRLEVGAPFTPLAFVSTKHRTPDDPAALDAATRKPPRDAHEVSLTHARYRGLVA